MKVKLDAAETWRWLANGLVSATPWLSLRHVLYIDSVGMLGLYLGPSIRGTIEYWGENSLSSFSGMWRAFARSLVLGCVRLYLEPLQDQLHLPIRLQPPDC